MAHLVTDETELAKAGGAVNDDHTVAREAMVDTEILDHQHRLVRAEVYPVGRRRVDPPLHELRPVARKGQRPHVGRRMIHREPAEYPRTRQIQRVARHSPPVIRDPAGCSPTLWMSMIAPLRVGMYGCWEGPADGVGGAW